MMIRIVLESATINTLNSRYFFLLIIRGLKAQIPNLNIQGTIKFYIKWAGTFRKKTFKPIKPLDFSIIKQLIPSFLVARVRTGII